MHRRLHIATAAGLLLLFGFFSVGLPIVRSFCPMMGTVGDACDMCSTSATVPTISYDMSACCKTVSGPERNKVEFIPVAPQSYLTMLQIVAVAVMPPPTVSAACSSLSDRVDTSPPPILHPDIPVSISALLI